MMEVYETDVVYVVAIRAREGDGAHCVRDVLNKIGPEIHHDDEYYAVVVAFALRGGRSKQHAALGDLGFDDDAADQIVPAPREDVKRERED